MWFLSVASPVMGLIFFLYNQIELTVICVATLIINLIMITNYRFASERTVATVYVIFLLFMITLGSFYGGISSGVHFYYAPMIYFAAIILSWPERKNAFYLILFFYVFLIAGGSTLIYKSGNHLEPTLPRNEFNIFYLCNLIFSGIALLLAELSTKFSTQRANKKLHKRNKKLEQEKNKLISDLEEIKQQDEFLMLHLEQKEILLREINHRIKNNLILVSSLVRYNLDKKGPRSFQTENLLNQLNCIFLMHDSTGTGTDEVYPDIKEYLERVVDNFNILFKSISSNISIKTDFESHRVSNTKLLNTGLIVNELLTNAMKHAFPNKIKGSILVKGNIGPNGSYLVSIKDNGVGYEPSAVSEGHGTGLVQALCKQIGAQVAWKNGKGTEVILSV